ncbi:hypothetical protein [Corynebacterium aquatimens]|uniref:hypothetical protein n=1 Tax=Corynebacterium aquatimens TaxID=1190508 RepID=UPI00253FF802|nr:hypothetical protein [Corynebacterium aquatimens]
MQTRNPSRIVGIDVARALALVGMFFAHLTFPNGIAGEVLYGFPRRCSPSWRASRCP